MNGVTIDPTVALTAARWDEAIAAFKSGWHEADYEGCKGNRVERGLERVFSRFDLSLAPKPKPVMSEERAYPPPMEVNPQEHLTSTVNRLLVKYDTENFSVAQFAEQLRQWFLARHPEVQHV